ncbi:MAG: hypothetical protein HY287_04260 [Planctomycetes bacterium]|nr:hypothetical protein [Planctomycetota bacterium]
MNEMTGTVVSTHPSLSFFDKAANWLAWALSIALFWTLGWMALAPADPQGAVSILSRDRSTNMLLQAAGLAIAASAAGAILAGRRIRGAGTFAAAIGLVAVSLRGGTMEKLLIEKIGFNGHPREMAISLALEAASWFAIIFCAFLVSGVMARWCYGRRPLLPDGLTEGAKHFGIVCATTLLAVAILSAGTSGRAITHGQSCFLVAASVAIACEIAQRIAPVESMSWALLGSGLAGILAYLWVAARGTPTEIAPWSPGSPYLRILPIQFVGMSAAAVVAMHWYLLGPISSLTHDQIEESPN